LPTIDLSDVRAVAHLDDDLEAMPPGYFVDPWFDTSAWCSLPWPTDPAEKDRLIASSIGPLLIEWAHGEWPDTHGPGLIHHISGEPWRYTPGQQRFLILWYSYTPDGRWVYRSGVNRGAKGTGKDPFCGAHHDTELVGPSQLVWDPRRQRWTGERHRMPLVQIAANSEAQAKDVLRVANALFPRAAREYYALSCGETRTIADGAGRHEILTASEMTSEGDPATHIGLNESHHMTQTSGGHRVAAVARRNVGKSPRELQARLCEYTNAHTPGNDSVAERSYLAWQAQVAAKTRRVDILYDSIEAPPNLDIYTDAGLAAFLSAAYADAPWADHERLAGEVLDPRTSVADTIRYYGNGLAAAEDAWIDPRRFDDLARPDVVVHDGEQIALFLDCSKSTDSTGLLGCRISDGHVFTIGLWQRPHGLPQKQRWLAPREEVDARVRATRDRYSVVWFGVDPSPARDDEDESLYWMSLADQWHRDFGSTLPVWATPQHAVLFDMRLSQRGGLERNRLFTEAAMATAKAIDEGIEPLTHDGDAGLRMHTHNARRKTNQWGVSLGKITRDSLKLVDLAVCMVGVRMGRRLALNSGKLNQVEPVKKAGRVRGWG
jgi:hypothetical protein